MPSTRDGDLPNIKSVAVPPQSTAAAPDVDGLLALALSRPNQALATARALLADGVGPEVAAVAHQAAAIVLRDFGDIDEALEEFRAAIGVRATPATRSASPTSVRRTAWRS